MPFGKGLLKRTRTLQFRNSSDYWEQRYSSDGNSGEGSYGKYAVIKADVLNRFVEDHSIMSVIEFGCGDGNQLSLFKFPSYIGLDVSSSVLSRCVTRFRDDPTKSFFLTPAIDTNTPYTAELSLSLDVIYHLVEDEVYLCH